MAAFIMSSTDQRILVTWPVVQASIRDVRLRQQNTVRSLATLELIVSHADKPVCPWRIGPPKKMEGDGNYRVII